MSLKRKRMMSRTRLEDASKFEKAFKICLEPSDVCTHKDIRGILKTMTNDKLQVIMNCMSGKKGRRDYQYRTNLIIPFFSSELDDLQCVIDKMEHAKIKITEDMLEQFKEEFPLTYKNTTSVDCLKLMAIVETLMEDKEPAMKE